MNHDDKQLVERIAGEANQTGYIDIQKLCFILAEDTEYDVKGLMRVLGIDTRFFPKQKGQTPFRERVGKWHYIIQKLISWDVAQKQENPIQLYKSSPTEGWCLIGAGERFHKNIQYAFIKLTDLEKWFTEVLKQPFPGYLIPRDTETQDQGAKDPNKWQFRFTGGWDIYFKGNRYSIDDVKPVRYILPLIERPGEALGYIELQKVADRDNPESHSRATDYEDGLRFYAPKNDKPTNEEKEIMRGALNIAYSEYRVNPDEQWDRWAAIKKFSENHYGVVVKESGDDLAFFDSKFQRSEDPNFKKVGKTVSQNKNRFLQIIKSLPASEPLYNHFKNSIVMEKGEIVYAPPDGSPDWEIIEQ